MRKAISQLHANAVINCAINGKAPQLRADTKSTSNADSTMEAGTRCQQKHDLYAARYLTCQCSRRRKRAKPDGVLQMIRRQVRITHGHGQAGVTQDLLQSQDIATVLDEMAGEGMPERVGGVARDESYASFLQQAVLPARAMLHEQGLKVFMNCERLTPASVTNSSRATPHPSTAATAIAVTATSIDRRGNRSALSSGITGLMWFRPTLEVERDQAL